MIGGAVFKQWKFIPLKERDRRLLTEETEVQKCQTCGRDATWKMRFSHTVDGVLILYACGYCKRKTKEKGN